MGQVYNIDATDTFMVEDLIAETRSVSYTHVSNETLSTSFVGGGAKSFTDSIHRNQTTSYTSGVTVAPASVVGAEAQTQQTAGGHTATEAGPSGTSTTTSTGSTNLNATVTYSTKHTAVTTSNSTMGTTELWNGGSLTASTAASGTGGDYRDSYYLTNETSATFAGKASNAVSKTVQQVTNILTNVTRPTWTTTTTGASVVTTSTVSTVDAVEVYNVVTATTNVFIDKTVKSGLVTVVDSSTGSNSTAPVGYQFYKSRKLVATSHYLDVGLAVYTASNQASLTSMATNPAPYALADASPITDFGVASTNGEEWGNYTSYTSTIHRYVVDNDPVISDADLVSHERSNGTEWQFTYDVDPYGGERITAVDSSYFSNGGGGTYYYPSAYTVLYSDYTFTAPTTVTAIMVSGGSASSLFTNSTFAGSSIVYATVMGQSVEAVWLYAASGSYTSTDTYEANASNGHTVEQMSTTDIRAATVADLTANETVRGGIAPISSQAPQVIARGPSRGYVGFNLSEISDLSLFTGSGQAGQTFESSLSAYNTSTANDTRIAPCTAMIGGYGRTMVDHGCGCTTASWTDSDTSLTYPITTTTTDGTFSTVSSYLAEGTWTGFSSSTTSVTLTSTVTTSTTAAATYGLSVSRKWLSSTVSAATSKAFAFTALNDRYETIKGTRTITLAGSVDTGAHFYVRLDDEQTAQDMAQFYAAPFDQATLTWMNLQLSLTLQASGGSSTSVTKHAATTGIGSLDVAGKNVAISCGELYLPSDGGEISKQLYYQDGASPVNKTAFDEP
jgi:hypothetical protein